MKKKLEILERVSDKVSVMSRVAIDKDVVVKAIDLAN
jgi:hypothetical protein